MSSDVHVAFSGLIRVSRFDLDYPIECDDEYWVVDDPQQAFKQPPGKPAMVVHFIQSLKLTEIHTRALRTIVRRYRPLLSCAAYLATSILCKVPGTCRTPSVRNRWSRTWIPT